MHFEDTMASSSKNIDEQARVPAMVPSLPPDPPAGDSARGGWAEQADCAEGEAAASEDAGQVEGGNDWPVIALFIAVAAVILFFVLFVLPSGEIDVHVH